MHSQMTFELATRLNCSSQLRIYPYPDYCVIHVIREDRLNFNWELVTVSHKLAQHIQRTTTKLCQLMPFTL